MQIETEFFPGAIGAIAMFHGEYYAEHWNFSTTFEAKVALGLASFALRKSDQDLVLLAVDEEGLAASLTLDLSDTESGDRGAHLRWFFAEDRCGGTGLGRQLMSQAMDHADQHSGGKAWLTTFAGLKPARALYDAYGFALAEEFDGATWGIGVQGQEFRRTAAQA